MVARPKFIPPQILFTILIMATAVHFIFHLEGHVSVPFRILGGMIFIGGFSYMMWAKSFFTRVGTSAPHSVNPTALVTDGPFQKTRNPMYVGGLVMLFGLALAVGTWPFFAVPFIMYFILITYFIPWEEQVMAEIFKDDYLRYKSHVPRWF